MTQIHCLKCKTRTATNNISEVLTKNNRKMLKGICKVCGSKKSQFIPMQSKAIESVPQKVTAKSNDDYLNVLREIYNTLLPIEKYLKKEGNGLYLGSTKNYQGGFLPLAALIPLLGGIAGGVGGLTGGIASAVSAAKANREQARHNRAIEDQLKSGSGVLANAIGIIPFVGNRLKPLAEKLGLGKESMDLIKNCNCKLKKHGAGLFLGKQS